ncbi:uncharacterized protein BYT42DRAFT_571320 [Radiomyces spectabilis]|uniref:uncharacterized protein n=1 Tax=Radiomyces spectabilis TaxID=64574 RepID=UPI00221FAF97|nr:uncharacterized protein BYT42DRAFT_571320 [Radiomyces spectabilis]KAI8377709.1 hypothetical protein BYT42DRAFT_571320 [Radiomyces spectabilis]
MERQTPIDIEKGHQALDEWLKGRHRGKAPIKLPDASIADKSVAAPFAQGKNTSDPNASAYDMFHDPKNHPDAVGAILTYCGTKMGYTPASLSQAEAAEKFTDYIEYVTTFPGFFLEHTSDEGFELTEVNVQLIASRLKDAYDGYVSVDVNHLIDSIEGLIQAVMSEKQQSAYKSLFDQSPVANVDGTMHIFINWVVLNMSKTQDGKTTVITQNYKMKFARLICNRTYLVTYAQKLADAIGDGSLDDWINQGTSNQNPAIKSCVNKIQ